MLSSKILIAALACSASIALPAAAPLSGAIPVGRANEPLRFFEGRTEMESVVKVMMKKPYRSLTAGRGQILGDGSLDLVQSVREQGSPTKTRRWKIRRDSEDRFSGTMSEAIGQVSVHKIGTKYRFQFKMKGNLAVDQWISPMPDGRTAVTNTTVRKLGIRVATSEGTIRRLN